MKAVFKDRIKAGKIDVPDHLQRSFSGVVTVTLDDQEANGDRDKSRKDAEAVDWIRGTMGTVPPFQPLSREEANERHPE